jgi:hypothetical protein
MGACREVVVHGRRQGFEAIRGDGGHFLADELAPGPQEVIREEPRAA